MSLEDKLGVRKRVSIVWKYFQKLNKYRVRCNICKHEQNYQSTTGNILRHLKSKHNIDATQRGQLDSKEMAPASKLKWENGEEVGEKEFLTDDEEPQTSQPNRQQRGARTKVMSYCEETSDPYAETSIQYDEYVTPGATKETSEQKCSLKRKHTAEEERIVAETDYFRQKAAYYKMQKNLTALQAKKIKYELDQLGR